MKPKLILIGSSTGGPGQLKEILCDVVLPPLSSVVIAQHMSKFFMKSFVNQFNLDTASDVILLEEKTMLKNKIYVCAQNTIISATQNTYAAPDESDIATIFNPNVNMLFNSAVAACKTRDVFAILMTGIGDDGAQGIHALYKAGATCIGEDEKSCVVYGMPKRAKELNPKLDMGSLKEIKFKLERFIDE